MAEENKELIREESKKLMVDFLEKNGMNYDALSPGKRDRYMKVSDAVYQCVIAYNKAAQATRDNTVSISRIAELTGISNKTFYNDKLLNDFISLHSPISKKESTKSTNELLKQAEDSSVTINKLIYNAIDTQELKLEIHELENENKNLCIKIKEYEETIEALQNELGILRKANECELIDFDALRRQHNK